MVIDLVMMDWSTPQWAINPEYPGYAISSEGAIVKIDKLLHKPSVKPRVNLIDREGRRRLVSRRMVIMGAFCREVYSYEHSYTFKEGSWHVKDLYQKQHLDMPGRTRFLAPSERLVTAETMALVDLDSGATYLRYRDAAEAIGGTYSGLYRAVDARMSYRGHRFERRLVTIDVREHM